MRNFPVLALVVATMPLAACSGGDAKEQAGGSNAAAPAPRPTGPVPQTPVLNVADAGNHSEWLEPRTAPDAPASAPFANLLDSLVVNAPGAR